MCPRASRCVKLFKLALLYASFFHAFRSCSFIIYMSFNTSKIFLASRGKILRNPVASRLNARSLADWAFQDQVENLSWLVSRIICAISVDQWIYSFLNHGRIDLNLTKVLVGITLAIVWILSVFLSNDNYHKKNMNSGIRFDILIISHHKNWQKSTY